MPTSHSAPSPFSNPRRPGPEDASSLLQAFLSPEIVRRCQFRISTWPVPNPEGVPVEQHILSALSPSLQLPAFSLSVRLQLGVSLIPAVPVGYL